jgi:hypothetical protein
MQPRTLRLPVATQAPPIKAKEQTELARWTNESPKERGNIFATSSAPPGIRTKIWLLTKVNNRVKTSSGDRSHGPLSFGTEFVLSLSKEWPKRQERDLNSRLKKAVAKLALDKQTLKKALEGNF